MLANPNTPSGAPLAGQPDNREIERAWSLARSSHLGQRDRFGRPFIDHVLRVAAEVRPWLDDTGVVAALLHDAVEKGSATFEDLLAAGIDPRAVEIVDILSQRSGEDDVEYLQRCAGHPVAKVIKRADLVDKLDPVVLKSLPDTAADDLVHEIAAKLATLHLAPRRRSASLSALDLHGVPPGRDPNTGPIRHLTTETTRWQRHNRILWTPSNAGTPSSLRPWQQSSRSEQFRTAPLIRGARPSARLRTRPPT